MKYFFHILVFPGFSWIKDFESHKLIVCAFPLNCVRAPTAPEVGAEGSRESLVNFYFLFFVLFFKYDLYPSILYYYTNTTLLPCYH